MESTMGDHLPEAFPETSGIRLRMLGTWLTSPRLGAVRAPSVELRLNAGGAARRRLCARAMTRAVRSTGRRKPSSIKPPRLMASNLSSAAPDFPLTATMQSPFLTCNSTPNEALYSAMGPHSSTTSTRNRPHGVASAVRPQPCRVPIRNRAVKMIGGGGLGSRRGVSVRGTGGSEGRHLPNNFAPSPKPPFSGTSGGGKISS
mmetsp:Transcript_3077/g.8806  ORF Transcript_3077/g.8806 Transcript_3077/m.8806 type:complete len:202 (+) Transcript_3077:254-859(+)